MQTKLARTHDYSASSEPQLTVAMIHGIASDSTAFADTLEYLEACESLRDVRFVTIDLLGSGKSGRGKTYNYDEQLAALDQALTELKTEVPLILLGHSMGTLIATRYAATHPGKVRSLILCSPPIYTEADLDNPAFEVAIKGFRDAVSVKNPGVTHDPAFDCSMKEIVMRRDNFATLAKITIPTALIYGDADPFIGQHNIPKVLKENPIHLKAKRTIGRHGMSREKNIEVRKILEEELNAEAL